MAAEDVLLRLRTQGARATQSDLDRTADSVRRVARQTDKLERSGSKITSSFRGAAGAIGAAAGGATLVAGLSGAVNTATDIGESLSKNEVLFGKNAAAIEAFAKTSATQFGISRASALEATGTFGNLFTAVGVAPKSSAKMSVGLTKLAADLASFNNASPEEALEAIRSGLVGETEPLRRFGVNLGDAELRVEAVRQGLVKTTKEALTPQQKALAVNALLFKQTATAQGDFARTSDGLANKQRIMRAQFSDASGTLGTLLLPALTDAANAASTFVQGIQDGTGAGGEFRDTLGEIWDKAEPVVTFLREHPELVAAAAGAWAAYKTAALVAMTAAKAAAFRDVFTGGGGPAAAAGGRGGRAYAKAFRLATIAGTIGIGVLIAQKINEEAENFVEGVTGTDASGRERARNSTNQPGIADDPVELVGDVVGAIGGFLGGRARGGPINRSGNYLIGERGPEILNLPAGSSVTPNSALGGMPAWLGPLMTTMSNRPVILVADGRELARVVRDQDDFQAALA